MNERTNKQMNEQTNKASEGVLTAWETRNVE